MPASRARRTVFALVLLAVIAAAVFAADQLVKNWIEATIPVGEAIPVIGDLLEFRHVLNPGAAFSIASGSTWIFSIIAAAVIVVIVIVARRIRSVWWAVLFGMVLGGTLGNLYDRLFRPPGFGTGYVVDYIDLSFFPAIFNIADIFIVSSACLFVLITLLGIGIDGSRGRSPEPAASAGAPDADEVPDAHDDGTAHRDASDAPARDER